MFVLTFSVCLYSSLHEKLLKYETDFDVMTINFPLITKHVESRCHLFIMLQVKIEITSTMTAVWLFHQITQPWSNYSVHEGHGVPYSISCLCSGVELTVRCWVGGVYVDSFCNILSINKFETLCITWTEKMFNYLPSLLKSIPPPPPPRALSEKPLCCRSLIPQIFLYPSFLHI